MKEEEKQAIMWFLMQISDEMDEMRQYLDKLQKSLEDLQKLIKMDV